MDYKMTSSVLDKGVYIIHNEEFKTSPEVTPNFNTEKNGIADDIVHKNKERCGTATPLILHYIILVVLGLVTWGLLWCAFGDGWSWDGRWFRLAVVASIAWASGQALEIFTSLPPLLAALLTGIVARNVGYLDMTDFIEIDGFLRKIYPVIILGKGSLGWDLSYMKKNWQVVSSLGVLPWITEVSTLAVCMHIFLDFPWMWGFLLGSAYASVSFAIVIPSVVKISSNKNLSQNWPQLICTAGGTDTALSVGVFGVIHSFMMYNGDEPYRYIKATLALFLGVIVGVSWGILAKFIPHSKDFYVAEIRLLFVLIGGLFTSFICAKYGWGGTGGVAVLACNATAAKCWQKDGWNINKNPASTAYRVMWSSLEPILFAYTGTFFVIKPSLSKVMLIGFGILSICLAVRLTVAFLVCSKLSVRERFFVCCAWIPKSIVEAVLCPIAITAMISRGTHKDMEIEYAEQVIRIIVQAILVTTPIGYLLVKHLGPVLLQEKHKKHDNETGT